MATIADQALTDKILDVLAGVAETDEVRNDPNLELYDLQILDSLKTVELIVAISQEFGVDISPAEFERADWATPAKIVANIQERMGA